MNLEKNYKKVLLELLSSCNLNCSHCFYRSSNKFHSPGFLTKEQIFVLIKKMVKNKISKLVLTGGEPTLHPDFIEISEYAMLKIPRVSICTNGVILSSELEDKIMTLNFSTYTVSVDSHIEKVHNEFRGSKNAFKKTISFIKKLNLNKKHISIHITIHPKNIDHIEETIDFCKIFSDEIIVSSIYHDKLKMNVDEVKKYNKEIKLFKNKYLNHPNIVLVGFTPFCKNKNCRDLKDIFMINRRGELVSCYWKQNGGTIINKY